MCFPLTFLRCDTAVPLAEAATLFDLEEIAAAAVEEEMEEVEEVVVDEEEEEEDVEEEEEEEEVVIAAAAAAFWEGRARALAGFGPGLIEQVDTAFALCFCCRRS